MVDQFMADLPAMNRWADGLMASRPPDFVIGERYLERWWVVPRNPFCNVYLHRINRSDDDRALHDHPWMNCSVVLRGGYAEHMPDRIEWRGAGDVVWRDAGQLHRLELAVPLTPMAQTSAITLFMTGPKVREWGFACPQGWVPWQEFADPDNPGMPGRGCGEA